jgi:hypothetical protein
MRKIATIAQAFFKQTETVSGLAKVEFITHFSKDDLRQVTRTPLLLISPHMMNLAYGRHRQRGTQLLIKTLVLSRNQRGAREWNAALDIMKLLDDIDSVIVNNDLGLAIQPFDIYRRETVEVEKGLSVVGSIYSTVIYGSLAGSMFQYLDGTGMIQAIEFEMVPTAFQTEEVLDANDYDRSLDGSMRVYNREAKRRYELRMTSISTALMAQLRAMKEAKTMITYYRDKDTDPTMTCFWTNEFNFFEESPGHWTGSVVLQES